MPRLRCPKCSTVVEVAPGQKPACPACGFGSAAKAAAPARASPAPAKRSSAVLLASLAVVGVLALGALATTAWVLLHNGHSGNAPGSGTVALTQEEARARLASGLQAMPQPFRQNASAEVRQVTMSFEPQAGEVPSGEAFFAGPGHFDYTATWGLDGVVRADLHTQQGAVTISVTAYCTPDRQILVVAGKAYAPRPSTDPSWRCDTSGPLASDGIDPAANDTPFGAPSKVNATDVTVHPDGSIHAAFKEPDGNGTADLDPQGRLTHLFFQGPETAGNVTVEYGARSAIALPATIQLVPASIDAREEFDHANQTLTWTVAGTDAPAPRADLEARFCDASSTCHGGTALAVFPLSADGPVSNGSVVFHYQDADGDGKVSKGDSFTIHDPNWGLFQSNRTVTVHDNAANGDINTDPAAAPGLGLPGALAAGLAALALRRRA